MLKFIQHIIRHASCVQITFYMLQSCNFSVTSGEWEYTENVSREGPDGTTVWEEVQKKVKGEKSFFKTEFKLVEYHGTVFE